MSIFRMRSIDTAIQPKLTPSYTVRNRVVSNRVVSNQVVSNRVVLDPVVLNRVVLSQRLTAIVTVRGGREGEGERKGKYCFL